MQFLNKNKAGQPSTKARGDAGEDEALAFLQERGLRLLQRNYRTPGRGGGEIDLIMQSPDGTVVFVEVRKRSRSDFGGAGSSIDGLKRSRIIFAARHYLMRLPSPPPCRFDVVLIDGGPNDQVEVSWFKAAFDAS